jgi:hypothetical protein
MKRWLHKPTLLSLTLLMAGSSTADSPQRLFSPAMTPVMAHATSAQETLSPVVELQIQVSPQTPSAAAD